MTQKRTFKILFVDNLKDWTENFICFFFLFLEESYPQIVKTCDFEFVTATNIWQGSDLITQNSFDAVIMEVVLPKIPGADRHFDELCKARRDLCRRIFDERGKEKPAVSGEEKKKVKFLLQQNNEEQFHHLSFSGGFEVLDKLRRISVSPESVKLPIIFVTTQPRADIVRGMQQFPSAPWRYFGKPLKMELVCEALLELLSLKN